MGSGIIQAHAEKKGGETVNILTHCNAGWLACVDWGTALAPIYRAHDEGIKVHVWVDETRPRNQGASLTAFELGAHGVPHTLIADNAGGHLMQKRLVDLCIVGTDRTTATGDVANKIGTYLKALAARDNDVPFFVALPVLDHRLELDRRRRHSHRGAGRRRGHPHDRALAGRQHRHVSRSRRKGRKPPITASTSRRRGSSPASSPSAAWRRRRRTRSRRSIPSTARTKRPSPSTGRGTMNR